MAKSKTWYNVTDIRKYQSDKIVHNYDNRCMQSSVTFNLIFSHSFKTHSYSSYIGHARVSARPSFIWYDEVLWVRFCFYIIILRLNNDFFHFNFITISQSVRMYQYLHLLEMSQMFKFLPNFFISALHIFFLSNTCKHVDKSFSKKPENGL